MNFRRRNRRWPGQPCHRAIVAVDVEDSTARTDTAKIRLRRTLYEVFENALHQAGIEDDLHDPLVDLGDGILAIIQPTVPKTLLLNTLMPTLGEQLTKQHELRLRAVVHAGEVLYDRRGRCVQSLHLSFRLLNAPEHKRLLTRTADPLALVVSEEIYRTVVSHGYQGIDVDAFALLVQTRVAGRTHRGWVWMSGGVTHVANQLRARAHPELGIDMGEMGGDGLGTEKQQRGDLGVGVPLRLAAENPSLARRLTELTTMLDHPGPHARDTTMALAQEWADLIAEARPSLPFS